MGMFFTFTARESRGFKRMFPATVSSDKRLVRCGSPKM